MIFQRINGVLQKKGGGAGWGCELGGGTETWTVGTTAPALFQKWRLRPNISSPRHVVWPGRRFLRNIVAGKQGVCMSLHSVAGPQPNPTGRVVQFASPPLCGGEAADAKHRR